MSQNRKTRTFPSSSKNSPQQSITTFKKRRGTTDFGKDYEHLYIGYLILKLITDAEIRNFYISSNDEAYGSFDDVIVEMEFVNKNQRETYACQLKQKQNNNKVLAREALTGPKGDFSFKKYFLDYLGTIILHDSVKMVLLTGRPTKVKGPMTLDFEGQPFEVQITEIQQIGHLFPSKRGSCRSFTSTNNRYNDFLENFFLCTGQASVEELRNEIRRDLIKKFHGDESVFQAYLSFIVNWSMKEGTKDKLDKSTMKRVVALCVLSSQIQPLSFSSNPVSKRARIFREAISKFDEAVIKKDNYTNIKKGWEDIILQLGNLQDINKVRVKYQLVIENIKTIGDLDCENMEVSKLLWLLGLCPLVVNESPQTYQAIKFCKDEKFLLLCSMGDSAQKLSHLRKEDIYKEILDNFTYTIEGQKEASLRTLVEASEEVDITIDHLAQMIDGPLLIGKDTENLPPCLIPRTLSRIVIESQYLNKTHKNTLIIICCVQDIKAFRERFTKNQIHEIENLEKIKTVGTGIYVSQNECSLSLFETLCSKLPTENTIHLLRYLNNNHLEWIKSKNNIDDLKQFYLEDTNHTLQESQLNSNFQENSLTIFCSNPGMGKSTLMKTLKQNSSSEFWTILIYARNHATHFRKNGADVQKFIQYILSNYLKKYSSLEALILSNILRKGHVQIIWDGLDEVSDYGLKIILNIIEALSKKKLNQWVTSRNNLKSLLEKRFLTFSRNIQQFDEKQQKSYIKQRLGLTDEELSEIFQKIVANIQLFGNNNILGIPLQIYMLTELFYRDRVKYLHLLEGFFSVADLYEHFVDEKFKIYYIEKEHYDLEVEIHYIKYEKKRESKIRCYQEVAFHTHFDRVVDESGIIFLEDIKNNQDRIGFITNVTEDNIPEFGHNTYGEYFAALYLSEHYDTEVRNRNLIFDDKYNNIRFFLDLILSKNCKGHIAVLYKNFKLFDACTDDDLDRKDKVGREILEVSCGWSKRIKIEHYDRPEVSSTHYFVRELDNLQYQEVLQNFLKIEHSRYLNRLMLLLPNTLELYIAASDHDNKKKFLEAILHYAVELNYPIIFQCIETVPWMKNTLNYITLKPYLEKAINSQSVDCVEILTFKFSCVKIFLEDFTLTLKICNVTFLKIFRLLIENDLDLTELLCYTCARGSALQVKFLIVNGAKVDAVKLDGKTPIHYVCLNNLHCTDVSELLIAKGATVNSTDLNGNMPLHYACQNFRNFQGAKLLINNGAEVNVTNSHGQTPLHYACLHNDYKIVKLLIDNGANTHIPNYFGQMPIHIACQYGKLQIFQLLTNKGAKIDVKDMNGLTPAHYACKYKKLNILKLLISLKVKLSTKNKKGKLPIHYACQYGNYSILKLLIQNGSHINAVDRNGQTPMHFICQKRGSFEKLRLLIDSGAEINVVNENNQMPIHHVCQRKGDYKTSIMLLIENNAKVNVPHQNGKVPIHYMCQRKSAVNIVKLLIDKAAKSDISDLNGQTPLHYACQIGGFPTVKQLLDAGMEVNIADHKGVMPIHYACQNGTNELIQLLLDNGANVNIKDHENKMPIHYVCRKNNGSDELKLLIDNGAEIGAPDFSGKTPIHYACQKGNIHAVQLLLDNHVEINVTDQDYQLPIHYACHKACKSADVLAKLLIDNGARLNVPNKKGKMPIHYASQNIEGFKLVKLLKDNGSKLDIRDSKGKMPIHYACEQKVSVEMVKLLINNSVQIDSKDETERTPIHYACGNNSFELVKFLADNGAEVNIADRNGKTPLHHTLQNNGNVKVLKLLLDNGAIINIPDKNGQTPIHYACYNKIRSLKLLELLIANGAKINAADGGGQMPIHYACHNNLDVSVVQLLLDNHTETNTADQNGRTPLHYAFNNVGNKIETIQNCLKLVKALTENGAEVNAADSLGQMAIHNACRNNADVKLVKMLIDKGAKIDFADQNGHTPLHHACKIKSNNRKAVMMYPRTFKALDYYDLNNTSNCLQLIKLLIDNGAEVNALDRNGQMPINYAYQNEEAIAAKLLSERGATVDISKLKITQV